MNIVVTYDVESERTRDINSFLSEYLDWKQQSVFEGTVSSDEYESIKSWVQLFVESGELVKIYNLTEGETISFGDEQSPTADSAIDPRSLADVGSNDSSNDDSINPMKL